MSLSILRYSLFTGLSYFATEPWHLPAFRFIAALGMGGEWALGVALVMELWPNASRAALAGWIGAFGNLGYTVCGLIALGLTPVGATELAAALHSVRPREGSARPPADILSAAVSRSSRRECPHY